MLTTLGRASLGVIRLRVPAAPTPSTIQDDSNRRHTNKLLRQRLVQAWLVARDDQEMIRHAPPPGKQSVIV